MSIVFRKTVSKQYHPFSASSFKSQRRCQIVNEDGNVVTAFHLQWTSGPTLWPSGQSQEVSGWEQKTVTWNLDILVKAHSDSNRSNTRNNLYILGPINHSLSFDNVSDIFLVWTSYHHFILTLYRVTFFEALQENKTIRLDSFFFTSLLIWFGDVWFYGISTIVGYLIPNSVYTYIYIKCNHKLQTYFVDNILKRTWSLFAKNKYFQVLLYHIYQPLHSGRIWHKVNFLSGV